MCKELPLSRKGHILSKKETQNMCCCCTRETHKPGNFLQAFFLDQMHNTQRTKHTVGKLSSQVPKLSFQLGVKQEVNRQFIISSVPI